MMRDLRDVDVDILTLGQYLRPSDAHIALDRYVTPRGIPTASRDRDGDGLPARRIGSARSLELPRVGAGAGGRRMSTEAKRHSNTSVRSARRKARPATMAPTPRRTTGSRRARRPS